MPDPDLIKPQTFDVRRPAYRNQKFVDGDVVAFVGIVVDYSNRPVIVLGQHDIAGAFRERDSIAFHGFLHDRGGAPVLLGHQSATGRDQADLGPKASEALRHLGSNRSCADDPESLGQFGEGEQCLIGQVGDRGESLDIGSRSASAGGNDSPGKLELLSVHCNGFGIDKFRLAQEYVDTEVVESFDRIDRTDVTPQLSHAFHGLAEVDRYAFRNIDPELLGIPNGGIGPSGTDDPF